VSNLKRGGTTSRKHLEEENGFVVAKKKKRGLPPLAGKKSQILVFQVSSVGKKKLPLSLSWKRKMRVTVNRVGGGKGGTRGNN